MKRREGIQVQEVEDRERRRIRGMEESTKREILVVGNREDRCFRIGDSVYLATRCRVCLRLRGIVTRYIVTVD